MHGIPISGAPSRDGAGCVCLTRREREVAFWAGRGLTNREIAAELFVSVKTVEFHVANVFAKLGVVSRYQLRDRAYRAAG